MRNINVAALALVAIATTAGTAAAQTVTVAGTGTGAGRTVNVTYQGTARSVFAGQINLSLTNSSTGLYNGSWISFCTELNQFIFIGGAPQVYNFMAVSDLPNPGAAMGVTRANAIARMYKSANGTQYAAAASDLAAAFQIAVWEISSDYDGTAASLNMSVGTMQAAGLSSAITTQLTTLFAAASSTTGAMSTLVGLGNATYQDQIIEAGSQIPTPGAVAMLGLAGVAGIGRRRRRE